MKTFAQFIVEKTESVGMPHDEGLYSAWKTFYNAFVASGHRDLLRNNVQQLDTAMSQLQNQEPDFSNIPESDPERLRLRRRMRNRNDRRSMFLGR